MPTKTTIPDNSVNPVLCLLKHYTEKYVMLCFSETVTTTDEYMQGAGALKDDGFPMPYDGEIIRMSCYDGTNVNSANGSNDIFSADDRISAYANFDSPYYQIEVRVNGVNVLYVSQVGANSDLFLTVLIKLKIPQT